MDDTSASEGLLEEYVRIPFVPESRPILPQKERRIVFQSSIFSFFFFC